MSRIPIDVSGQTVWLYQPSAGAKDYHWYEVPYESCGISFCYMFEDVQSTSVCLGISSNQAAVLASCGIERAAWLKNGTHLRTFLLGRRPLQSIKEAQVMSKTVIATRSGLALVAAVLGLLLTLIAPAPANAYTAHHLCNAFQDRYQCVNLKGGVVQAGTRFIMWSYASKNSDFVEDYVGKVSSSNEWPFTPGSGNNSNYNGYSVYEYRYQPNTNWCMAIDPNNIHHVVLQSCSNGPGRYWVATGLYPNNILEINVYATNHASNYTPQYLYINNYLDGYYVYAEPSGLSGYYGWIYW
jgi:hypothetical protein